MSVRRVSALGAIVLGLVLTLALGVYLRWFLAGVGVALPSFTRFEYLRHAHSHLGYYAVLVPLAWLAWRARGVIALHPREAWAYGAFTALAALGFVQAGYGLSGIVGSTVVGTLWLLASWRAARAARGSDDPLQVVFCGTVAALACIPVIAISLRSDPALAAAAVQSFLALMLFLVVAPSALTAVGLAQRGAWGLCIAGLGAGAALGLWHNPLTRAALALLALYWIDAARRMPNWPLRAAWGSAALGLLALAIGLVPNTRDVAVGAVHFLVLGPLLMTLAAPALAAAVREGAWWIYLAAVGALAGPLVLRAFGTAPQASAVVSAVGGTAVLLWWIAALAQWSAMFTVRPPAART